MDSEMTKRPERRIIDEATKQSIKQYFGIDIDGEILSPTVDCVFKRIFTADEHRSKIALMGFLNSVFEFENEKTITDLTVVNPIIPTDIVARKKAIFDVRVRFNDGEQAIIEMQVSDEHNFKKRSQFIVSKSYTSQEIAGLDYNALKKCYLIAILNFLLLGDKGSFVNDYRFRDRAGNDLTADETIIFVELPKIDKILDKPVAEMTNLEMWVLFFRYVTDKSKRDVLNTIINRNGGIEMAVDVLNEISSSELARIQYENELIYELDVNSRLNYAEVKGKIEGKIEGKVELAKNLLSMGFSLDDIIKAAGFSEKEIEELKN